MTETTKNTALEQLKAKLEAAQKKDMGGRIGDAIRDLLAAISYEDDILLESSAEALFVSLADVAADLIRADLKRAGFVKQVIRSAFEEIDGVACEDFDELKNTIESIIDVQIGSMMNGQKLVEVLKSQECVVENADQLEEGIRSLRLFRENLIKGWPSTDRQPSPLNTEAIAKARTAIANGCKGLRKGEMVYGREASMISLVLG